MLKRHVYLLKMAIIFSIMFLSACSASLKSNDVPLVKGGQIDVSKWDFKSSGNIRLDGQWEFYWNQLIDPDEFQLSNQQKTFIDVPGKWNKKIMGNEILSGSGYGTYRLNIKFDESELHTDKALFLMNVYTSYRLWIDGKLADEKGKVGQDPDNYELNFEYEIIEFAPTKEDTEIVIQVANFDHFKGGITTYISLGNEQSIDRTFSVRQGIELFVIGGLVLMGFYHIALYTTRREDPSSLFFGLFCIVIAIYSLFGSSYEFVYTSLMDWPIILKVEYITVYIIPPIFLLYVKTLYPRETKRIVIWIFFLLFLGYSLITLCTDSSVFTKLMPSYNIILLAAMGYLLLIFTRGVFRKRIGAKLILTMFFIFVLTAIHDIFYYSNHYIFNMKIASLGCLFFIGAHSYVLSLRFAKAFRDVEELTNEIEITQREIIYTLGEIGEVRSEETGNHVKRVAEYSKLLALKYGLTQKEVELIKLASPMHDVGKVGIPDSILNKPGKLTPDEFEVMKRHSIIGYEMLKHSSREILQCAAEIALTHHERWNGTGYPNGLKGEDIPIMGRITAVADVFDALGSDRVYKKAWELEEILEYFRCESGEQFDPKIVSILFENLEQLLEIKERYADLK